VYRNKLAFLGKAVEGLAGLLEVLGGGDVEVGFLGDEGFLLVGEGEELGEIRGEEVS
jgi:hypothetical protein